MGSQRLCQSLWSRHPRTGGTFPLTLLSLASPHLSGFLQDLFQEDKEVARVPADQLL